MDERSCNNRTGINYVTRTILTQRCMLQFHIEAVSEPPEPPASQAVADESRSARTISH